MAQKRTVSIRMTNELAIESRVVAARLNLSRSAFIVRAVKRAIWEHSEGGQRGGSQKKVEVQSGE